MSVDYNAAVITDRLQVVIDAIDAGAGSGILNIGTTAMGVVLSTIILNKPCATIVGNVIVFSGLPLVDGSAAATGVAAAGEITDSTGTIVISGLTVGTVGTDIIISDAAIDSGALVTFQVGTITGS